MAKATSKRTTKLGTGAQIDEGQHPFVRAAQNERARENQGEFIERIIEKSSRLDESETRSMDRLFLITATRDS